MKLAEAVFTGGRRNRAALEKQYPVPSTQYPVKTKGFAEIQFYELREAASTIEKPTGYWALSTGYCFQNADPPPPPKPPPEKPPPPPPPENPEPLELERGAEAKVSPAVVLIACRL